MTDASIDKSFPYKTIFTFALISILLFVASGYIFGFLGPPGTQGFGLNTGESSENVVVTLYEDENCTQTLTTLDWGFLSPGDTAKYLIYLQNNGNVNATLDFFSTRNHDPPELSNYMLLTWNYTGQILEPNEVIPIKFDLYVSPSLLNVTNFRFDIVVTSYG
jgi:hypothetical protein